MDLWSSNIHDLEYGNGAYRVIDERSKLTILGDWYGCGRHGDEEKNKNSWPVS